MALQTFSIGSFIFRTMRGPIDVVQRDMEIIQRDGLDSYELRALGEHSTPFSILTMRDVLNVADGRLAGNNFATLVGADPVQMVFANYSLQGESRTVAVLNVRTVDLQAAFPMVNPINPASTMVLRSLWTLMLR